MRDAGCSPERAAAIVQLLLNQDPAADLIALLGRKKKPAPPPVGKTGRGRKLPAEVREFILGPECQHLTLENIVVAVRAKFGLSFSRSTISLCLQTGGKAKREPHKMKTAVKRFVQDSMGLAPADVCTMVKERWGTEISVGSVYKAWKEKNKSAC